jgi:integrase/recombinase XerD
MKPSTSSALARRALPDSDLNVFLTWCAGQGLDPLTVGRVDIERYVRWLQDVRCYQPSTVSRRLSVVVGFYRMRVIDQVLPYSPADYVRRPSVPAESPTLGLGHLQFEALITTARLSANINDFALIAMLGLLGLRIFEACGASFGPLPPAVARAIDRAVDGRDAGPILRNAHGVRMDRHAASRRLRQLADAAGIRIPRMHHVRDHHARRRRQPPRRADRRPPRRPKNHHALRPGPQEPRPAPQLHPRRLHGIRHVANPRAERRLSCP